MLAEEIPDLPFNILLVTMELPEWSNMESCLMAFKVVAC